MPKRMMRKRTAKEKPREKLKKAKRRMLRKKIQRPVQAPKRKMESKKTMNLLDLTKPALLHPKKVLIKLLKLRKKKMIRPISNSLGKCSNSPKRFSLNMPTLLKLKMKNDLLWKISSAKRIKLWEKCPLVSFNLDIRMVHDQ